TIVTGSADGTVRLWAALPAGSLQTIYRNPQWVTALWAGQNPVVVAGAQVHILNTSGRRIRQFLAPAPIVAAAAYDSNVAVADNRGDLEVLGPGGGTFNGRHVSAVSFEPDGTLLFGTSLGEVEAWSLHSPTLEARTVRVGGPVLGLSAGGDRFLVQLATSVRVYSDDGKLLSVVHVAAKHARLSPGGLAVATTTDAVAQLWDAETGRLL